MQIVPRSRIRRLLRVHPRLEEVFEWHDIPVEDDEVEAMSLKAAAREFDADLETLLDDVRRIAEESGEENEWMAGDDDDEYVDEDDEDDDDVEEEEEEEVAVEEDDTSSIPAGDSELSVTDSMLDD